MDSSDMQNTASTARSYNTRSASLRTRGPVNATMPSQPSNNRSNVPSQPASDPNAPPRFVIDLSLPPEQRHLEVSAAFKQPIKGVVPLFDEVVGDLVGALPKPFCLLSISQIHRLARLLLRRVYDQEENRELRGISKATGVEMHLLVTFNVLLDALMGCSSGGALVQDKGTATKMVHFRTLDWGMPTLRKLIVQLDFKTRRDRPTVCSSITYAGYVGVLTGVRKDFSVSLNFRPNRSDDGKLWSDLKYYWHLSMVILGKRRSISSQLRTFLLPSPQRTRNSTSWRYRSYANVVSCAAGTNNRRAMISTACYLCFSDGKETTVVEKDRATAVVRSSTEFIAIANNDLVYEADEPRYTFSIGEGAISLADFLEDAANRRQCAERNYYNMRRNQAAHRQSIDSSKEALDVHNIIEMVQCYPTTNEVTHFSCVMDPKEGIVSWCRRFPKPITQRWIREHQGVS